MKKVTIEQLHVLRVASVVNLTMPRTTNNDVIEINGNSCFLIDLNNQDK
jgi:hypothetical protein